MNGQACSQFNAMESSCQSLTGRLMLQGWRTSFFTIILIFIDMKFRRPVIAKFILFSYKSSLHHSGCIYSGKFGTCTMSIEGWVRNNFFSPTTEAEMTNLTSMETQCASLSTERDCRDYKPIQVQQTDATLACALSALNVHQSHCIYLETDSMTPSICPG